MSPSPSEHYGWPAFYEAAEQGRDLIAERDEALRKWEAAERERRRQQVYQEQAERLLVQLRAAGLLRSDRLSYTRICELEWDTGQGPGSWSDFYQQLCEAQRKDLGDP
jgi:hypothetical protein